MAENARRRANVLRTSCTPDYLMNVIARRLEARNALPSGAIVISEQMMTQQLHEPWQLVITPINMPLDKSNDIGLYGTIMQSVFHIYYRHRNMVDIPMSREEWLASPEIMQGFYATLGVSYDALVDWWPQGDLPDDKQGKLLTTRPIEVNYWNEPRTSYRDKNLGEGMFEIRCRYRYTRGRTSEVV